MYKTHPKTTIVAAVLAMALAFALPAFAPISALAQTAGGLHLALLILAMVVIRIMVPSADDTSWPVAVSIYLACLAGITALRVSSDDSFGDVAEHIGGLAFTLSAGFAGAIFALRPRGWGNMPGRVAVILLSVLAGVMVWNHMFLFPNAQGLALMCSLAFAAILANLPSFDAKEFVNLDKPQRMAMRVIYGGVLAILVAAVGAHEIIQTGAFALSDIAFHLIMGIMGATLYFEMMLWAGEQA
jgi:hypothetical protein